MYARIMCGDNAANSTSVTWSDADPNFISYARWDHPLSEKSHSYYFEVVSPSRYMNGGIHPRYLGNTTNYPMRACVRLHQDALNVNNRYRPVLVLTTMRRIKKHEELLLDYGVLDDGIYYEFLRRGKRYPDSRSERDFSGFLNQAHRMWLSKNGSKSTTDPRDNEIFLNEFAQAYFKQPDRACYR